MKNLVILLLLAFTATALSKTGTGRYATYGNYGGFAEFRSPDEWRAYSFDFKIPVRGRIKGTAGVSALGLGSYGFRRENPQIRGAFISKRRNIGDYTVVKLRLRLSDGAVITGRLKSRLHRNLRTQELYTKGTIAAKYFRRGFPVVRFTLYNSSSYFE